MEDKIHWNISIKCDHRVNKIPICLSSLRYDLFWMTTALFIYFLTIWHLIIYMISQFIFTWMQINKLNLSEMFVSLLTHIHVCSTILSNKCVNVWNLQNLLTTRNTCNTAKVSINQSIWMKNTMVKKNKILQINDIYL